MPTTTDDNPAPGTGTSYTPKAPEPTEEVKAAEAPPVKQTESISKSAAEAGITLPANVGVAPQVKGTFIPQASDDELYAELDEMDLKQFVKKHTDDRRANIDAMARVTRLSAAEIVDVQRELGYPLPEGA